MGLVKINKTMIQIVVFLVLTNPTSPGYYFDNKTEGLVTTSPTSPKSRVLCANPSFCVDFACLWNPRGARKPEETPSPQSFLCASPSFCVDFLRLGNPRGARKPFACIKMLKPNSALCADPSFCADFTRLENTRK